MDDTTTRVTIGKTDIRVPPLGIGTWSWGDKGFWGYGGAYGQQDVEDAFIASTNAGITLFDTAEVYGMGESERILGNLVQKSRMPVVIASKYLPMPWHLSPRDVRHALDRSVQRLNVERIDLYQVHAPTSLLSTRALMDVLADAVAEGKVRAVGVSNYNAEQMRRAHEALDRRGVPLASNQVHYSLLKRSPEVNGVLEVCHELDITLIAYSPLAKGLLTGKYTVSNPPGGFRYLSFVMEDMRGLHRVIELLTTIGQDHGGKTPSQVALNWLMCQERVLPIPGAKTARQATTNAGALGWSLTASELDALDQATRPWRT
jgi:aryl-alcohol dehydrogenase-like predicted oxidoreductase